jgi:hypothetical protein
MIVNLDAVSPSQLSSLLNYKFQLAFRILVHLKNVCIGLKTKTLSCQTCSLEK